ncbi:hypothetical protein A6046_04535 [[Haemophilus] ducreyi]|nr:DUF805 domain-containing protein [[Haemophilus] ducreyi]AKO30443.1 membrane protein [[Haemophilus] ducreyi]AKO31878.1 membrane protein [[Haemophilus] ducreyi]AKO33332.1 membrane protein [[Haemophilus] ducreyi]AKO34780.1 membrane protein [[Haemophilus] ducreyi]AKO36206.1 membrane protein [[Haemophilus] ducreyi]
MIWYKALFSFNGRLNRQGFWIGFGINFIFLFIIANFGPKETAFSLTMVLPLLLASYSCVAVIIKRLHDRNRSARAILMMFIPLICYGVSLATQGTMAWLLGVMMPMFIGTMLLLEWGVFKSYPQANQYGEKGETFCFT